MERLMNLITLKIFSIKKSFIVLTFIMMFISTFFITLEFQLFSYLENTFSTKIYSKFLIVVVLLTVIIAVTLESIIFYRLKLKEPIRIIAESSEKIRQNNLDFKVEYQSNDEFGQICISFEKMRFTLENNFLQLWEADNRQKRFISSFIHDIHTPLTILKGYIEIIESHLESDKILEDKYKNSLEKMKVQVLKIEDYTKKIRSLQDKNYSPIIKSNKISKEDFIKVITESVEALLINTKGRISIDISIDDLKEKNINIDILAVTRVLDNILSNSLRYAEKLIQIGVVSCEDDIIIRLKDDGPGFSKEDLLKAKEAFYKGEKGKQGLGLYISSLLCESHGGKLELCNHTKGGAIITASFKQVDN